ncbi:MAG: NADH-quinone oxidoreductase subunit L [Syntrophobacteraceae bacterium]|nr:NADH-quinone oxidoreductase subunit L [Syntrophobacteraceae bacterium]
MRTILFLLVFLPLAGALFHILAGRHVSRRVVEIVACSSVAGSFFMALSALLALKQGPLRVIFLRWFEAGDFHAAMDVYYDPLSAVMALMVTFVSALIHVYSVGYMRDDEDYARFFFYLNLFVFCMLVITLADDLVFLFLGWEGVGFCSYALIGFWYRDEANAAAGRKAFLLTRLGDVAFGVALGLVFVLFNRLSISHVTTHATELTAASATVLGLLLLWAAVGKSAQLPLVVWLPDAMAGPTPVSALIHAATMVTAGVYLLMRLFPVVLMSEAALSAIAVVGVLSAFYAACAALAQKDIKRVLAYSTISQLGYMFLAVGAGDVIGSMSFLLSHAFYKALLFLAAGCVIRALHEEHDIFRMGGLRGRLPAVFFLFLAGVLSLGAIPGTGGFINKDRILVAVFSHPHGAFKILWLAAVATSFLTTLYAFRLLFVVFLGRSGQSVEQQEIHPIPAVMTRTLWPLAFLALFAGFMNLPAVWGGEEWLAGFLGGVPGTVPHLHISPGIEWFVAMSDGVVALAAAALAFVLYGPVESTRWRAVFIPAQTVRDFFLSGFYLDRLYQAVLARPYMELARILWLKVDEGALDGCIAASSRTFPLLGSVLRLWTTGRISTYLLGLLVGLTVMLGLLVIRFYAG